jgi:N-acetylglucosamine-6-phosphate deacetylase
MSDMPSASPEGYILTPSGWALGRLVIEAGRIARIDAEPVRTTDRPDKPYILPGFIDLHVHGAEGVDYSSGEENVRKFIRYHARSGTVALTPTTSTSPVEVIESSLADIDRIRRAPRADEPTVLGAHLEGPFINAGKLGAQRNMTLKGDPALATRWMDICPLRVATVAPEIEGGIRVVETLASRGCRVQIGHSLATAEETAHGFARGLSGFTHLFNGMTGAHHRDAGVAAYALGFGQYAELILDLNHVSPTMVMAAYRAIPRLYAITDATTAAGMPDGTYNFSGDHPIVKKGLTIMLADGSSLAGSAITMLDAFRNLVSLGLSIAQASDLCATRQAEYLGLEDYGVLVPGRSASFVVLGSNLDLNGVWLRGQKA